MIAAPACCSGVSIPCCPICSFSSTRFSRRRNPAGGPGSLCGCRCSRERPLPDGNFEPSACLWQKTFVPFAFIYAPIVLLMPWLLTRRSSSTMLGSSSAPLRSGWCHGHGRRRRGYLGAAVETISSASLWERPPFFSSYRERQRISWYGDPAGILLSRSL